MLLIGKWRFSKVFQAMFNYRADFISFSWCLYPFQGHGEGARAHPSCWWEKAGYTSDCLTCSLQYCVSNCLFSTLFNGTSALPRRCSGTFPDQNTFPIFASTGVWTEYHPLLSPALNRQSQHCPVESVMMGPNRFRMICAQFCPGHHISSIESDLEPQEQRTDMIVSNYPTVTMSRQKV